MILQETFVIEDCIDCDSLTSASGKWTIPSSANATYSNNGMRIAGSSWSDCYFEEVLTKPYSVEFDLIDYGASGSNTFYFAVYFYNESKTRLGQVLSVNNGKTEIGQYGNALSITYTPPKGSHIKITIEDNLMKIFVDDELKASNTYNLPSTSIVGVTTSGSRNTTYKNWKIKPL